MTSCTHGFASPASCVDCMEEGNEAMSDAFEEVDDICGESYDHDVRIDYEDDEIVQWTCRECGAEGFEEKS